MVEVGTRDLVCLYLETYDDAAERSPAPRALTATGIGDALEVGDSAPSRVRLLDVLAGLESEGFVVAEERPVEGHDAPRTVYALTSAGREHAAAVRDRVEEATVTLTNGTTEEVELADVGRYLEGERAPLVTALARLTDDGRVPLAAVGGDGFVGREDALATVREAITASFTRGSRTVVVTGASGMGKTALVERALESVADDRDGLRVARGTCPPGPTAPYDPLRQAFESVSGGGELLASLADASERLSPDDPEKVAAQRSALFADVAGEVRALADDGPLVVFVDNLHWADDATRDLFAHLATTIREWVYPVAFVGTYRESPVVTGDHPLADTLEHLERTEGYTAVTLDPLDRADTRALLSSVLGHQQLPSSFVDLVHERTGGNPLFVRETAAHLLETGRVDPGADSYPEHPDAVTLPEEVTEQVDQRLALLDEESRELLRLGAVIGERVSGSVLDAATDLPPARRREYVDLLVASRIWEPVGGGIGDSTEQVAAGPTGAATGNSTTADGGGDYRFTSGGVREAVVDRLSPATARTYHRRVAEAFVDVYGDDLDERAARVAHHYERAGDREAAVEHYRSAGDHARDTYANDDAIANYRRALSLGREAELDGETLAALARELASVHALVGASDAAIAAAEEGLALAGDDPEQRCRLLATKARSETARGDYDAARETAAGQRDLADRHGLAGLRADAVKQLGEVARKRGEYDDARAKFERSIETFRELGEQEDEARALKSLGILALFRNDYETATERFHRSLTAAREVDAPEMEASSLNNLGVVAQKRGAYAEAETYFEECLDIARELGDRQNVQSALHNIGLVAYLKGEFERARDHHERSLAIARELGDRSEEANSLNNLGIVARETGDHGDARRYFEDCLEIAKELGDRKREAEARNNLGLVLLDQGDHEAAREQFDRSLAIDRELDNRKGQAETLGNLGAVAQRQGRYEAAREYHERNRDITRDIGDRRGLANSHDNLASVARSRGAYDRARELDERALEIRREIDDRRGEAKSLNELGVLARRRGDHDRARERHEAALAVARDLDHPVEHGRALAGLGAVARERGDLETADEHLAAAVDRVADADERRPTGTVQLQRARLALARGDHRTAREWAGRARETFAALSATLWTARARRLLGRVAAAADDLDGAVDHWRAALDTFTSVGAPDDALATLEHLVRDAPDDGDWCSRARALLSDAPSPVADRHRDWVDERCPE